MNTRKSSLGALEGRISCSCLYRVIFDPFSQWPTASKTDETRLLDIKTLRLNMEIIGGFPAGSKSPFRELKSKQGNTLMRSKGQGI